MSHKPKLYLVPVATLRGNVAHEWRAAGPLPAASERRANAGAFWRWLARLTVAARERARGSLLLPSGRAGW